MLTTHAMAAKLWQDLAATEVAPRYVGSPHPGAARTILVWRFAEIRAQQRTICVYYNAVGSRTPPAYALYPVSDLLFNGQGYEFVAINLTQWYASGQIERRTYQICFIDGLAITEVASAQISSLAQ